MSVAFTVRSFRVGRILLQLDSRHLLIFLLLFYIIFMTTDPFSCHDENRLSKGRHVFFGRRPIFNVSEGKNKSSSPLQVFKRAATLKSRLPLCPERPRELVGPLRVAFDAPSFEEIAEKNPLVKPGGQFCPSICTPVGERTVVIIPYRNRDQQLRALLHHLHPILQRQMLNYAIVVVEQAGNGTFNKALLMNIAFNELTKQEDNGGVDQQFQCFIFHDVDLHIQDDRAIYACAEKPIHLSEFIDKFNYQPYCGTDVLFGGAVSIKRRLFQLVNGYSNVFFGWGAEDEEMRFRLRVYKIPILTPDPKIYRFKMFRHGPDPGNSWNPKNSKLLMNASQRMGYDGLNSLRYSLIKRDLLPTHTHLLVSFDEEEVLRAVFGEKKAPA